MPDIGSYVNSRTSSVAGCATTGPCANLATTSWLMRAFGAVTVRGRHPLRSKDADSPDPRDGPAAAHRRAAPGRAARPVPSRSASPTCPPGSAPNSTPPSGCCTATWLSQSGYPHAPEWSPWHAVTTSRATTGAGTPILRTTPTPAQSTGHAPAWRFVISRETVALIDGARTPTDSVSRSTAGLSGRRRNLLAACGALPDSWPSRLRRCRGTRVRTSHW
jgi:hypothetical protein